MITRRQYRRRSATRTSHLKAGELYKRIQQPYFFSYVRDELGACTARRACGTAASASTRRSIRACSATRGRRSSETLNSPSDPAAAVVAINPANGAIRAMTAVSPGRKNNQFNLIADAHRQAGSTFKAFVLAAAVEEGMDPRVDVLPLGAAPLRHRPVRRQAVGRADVRRHVHRQHVGRAARRCARTTPCTHA